MGDRKKKKKTNRRKNLGPTPLLQAYRDPKYPPVGSQKKLLHDTSQNRRPPRLPGLHGAANPGHSRPPTRLGHRPPHRANQRRRAGVETGNPVPSPAPPATDGMDHFEMGRVR